MLIDFCTATIEIHMGDSHFVHPKDERIKLILEKIDQWMKLPDCESRKSAAEIWLFFIEYLKIDPKTEQRPLIKIMPLFLLA